MRTQFVSLRTYFLIASAVGFAVSYSVLHNDRLHTRFNLLLHGHLLSRLVPLTDARDFPGHAKGQAVSRLVYSGDEYIGCLDLYGQFIPRGKAAPAIERIIWATEVVSVVSWTMGLFFILTSTIVVHQSLLRRRPEADGVESHHRPGG